MHCQTLDLFISNTMSVLNLGIAITVNIYKHRGSRIQKGQLVGRVDERAKRIYLFIRTSSKVEQLLTMPLKDLSSESMLRLIVKNILLTDKWVRIGNAYVDSIRT
jgi:hypothetical protein